MPTYYIYKIGEGILRTNITHFLIDSGIGIYILLNEGLLSSSYCLPSGKCLSITISKDIILL